jgi:hypothetical protein
MIKIYKDNDLIVLKDKEIIRGWSFDVYKKLNKYTDDDIIEVQSCIYIKEGIQ